MHDEGFRGSLDQVAFGGVGRNDVAHRIRNSAFERQRNTRERVSQSFSAFTLTAPAVRAQFVFQQLANVGQNCSSDYGIKIYRQSMAHERLHRHRTIARDVHNAALVLHESDRAVGDEERERNLIQIVGLERAALQRLNPGLGNLLT